MTKPIPDKAEVALEYPDKLYIGTFERSARFDAHLDQTGISLTLQRMGDAETRRSIRMHLHYGLLAEILREVTKTVSAIPADDTVHLQALQNAVSDLNRELASKPTSKNARPGKSKKPSAHRKDEVDTSGLTPEEEVRLLHIME